MTENAVSEGSKYSGEPRVSAVSPYDTYWNSFLPAFMDRMSLQMRKNMTAIVEPYGLSHAHAIYLIALNLQDGQTMVGLSRFLDLDTANTNRVIKTLREKGFVYDDRKSESNKKFRIFLSDSGKALADLVMTKITELNNSYFANIPREDILNLRNTLIQVLNNMNLDIDEYMNSKSEDPFYTHLHLMPQVDGYESLSTRAPSRIVREKN